MVKKKTKAVCVPLSEAEPVRRTLRKSNLLSDDIEILKEGKFIYFPIKEVTEVVTPERPTRPISSGNTGKTTQLQRSSFTSKKTIAQPSDLL